MSRERLLAVLAVALGGFVLLGVAHDGALGELDADVSARVAESLPAWVEWLARPFSWLGGWIGLTALGIVVGALLARQRRWPDVVLLVVALAVSQLAVAILKDWYDRPRPDAGSAVPLPDSAAFPSGHATAGVAALGALALLLAERLESRRARMLLWTGASLAGVAVGLSRVALNVHYPSDVAAGWCLGAAWLAGCLLVREQLRSRELLVPRRSEAE